MRATLPFLLPALLMLAVVCRADDPKTDPKPPEAKPADKKAPDPKQFEGTWEVLSETWAGWQMPDEYRVTEITFKGNVIQQVSKHKTELAAWRFPMKQPPQTKAADDAGKKDAEPPAKDGAAKEELPAFDIVDQDEDMGYFAAIYKLDKEKDTLTICYVIRRSLDRPTEFTSTKDNANCLLVLKRKKA